MRQPMQERPSSQLILISTIIGNLLALALKKINSSGAPEVAYLTLLQLCQPRKIPWVLGLMLIQEDVLKINWFPSLSTLSIIIMMGQTLWQSNNPGPTFDTYPTKLLTHFQPTLLGLALMTGFATPPTTLTQNRALEPQLTSGPSLVSGIGRINLFGSPYNLSGCYNAMLFEHSTTLKQDAKNGNA